VVLALLFVSVLLHELGHVIGARRVDGDAMEVLLWPLGGLAYVDVPQTARANFIATAAGPAVNLVICLVAGLLLTLATTPHLRPPLNPFWYPYRMNADGAVELNRWNDAWFGQFAEEQAKSEGSQIYKVDKNGGLRHVPDRRVSNLAVVILARLFYVSWITFLFNVLIWGFPLDGGRMFQCILWPRLGYYQATKAAVFAGFIYVLLIGIYAIAIAEGNAVLTLCLALFIYVNCKQQWMILEHGESDSPFGYDFSQGYTSLERDQQPTTAPRRRKQNWLQRWLQRRAARKMQREAEQREAEERRMDELLEKVQREGLQSLTDEERRFLTRVSAKYRNRQ
jgi:Zn-dependent protease